MFGKPSFDSAKLRQHRLEQAGAGFPLLRRCPNTSAISLLLFLDGLSAPERTDYARELTLLEEAQAARPPTSSAEMHDLVRSFPLVAQHMGPILGMVPPVARPRDFRRIPVKLLSKLLKEAGSGGVDQIAQTLLLSDDPAARLPAKDHAASLEELVPVAPARLRKLVDQMMKEAFGAEPQRLAKDHTVYEARLPGGHLKLHAMFAPPGRMMPQFDYRLEAALDGKARAAFTYEEAWWLPASWDYLTESNAGPSISRLGELVKLAVALL
jgi:hypothetical protein